MSFEQDAVELLGGVRHGAHPRLTDRGRRSATRSGRSGRPSWRPIRSMPAELEGLGSGGAADPARDPATPTSSGCRSTASTTPGRSSSEPARARPRRGSRSARSRSRSCGPGARTSRCSAMSCRIGTVAAPDGVVPARERPRRDRRRPGAVRRTPRTSAAMVAEIDAARNDGDTLGGVVEVVVLRVAARPRQPRPLGPPAGLAARWRADGRSRRSRASRSATASPPLAGGGARPTTRSRHDRGGVRRRTGRAGGTEGGMSTGDVLRVRAAMKPISTVPRALDTIDVATGEPAKAINQRSDVCAVPASGRGRGGDGRARARRRGAREVRRRLGRRDPAQLRHLPRSTWS